MGEREWVCGCVFGVGFGCFLGASLGLVGWVVVCHLLGEEKGRRCGGGGVAVWFRFVLSNVFQCMF